MTRTALSPEHATRVVYKAVHRPLTICGAERRLFFMALMVGAAVFNLFYTFVGGLLVAAGLYIFALWATRFDVQMLRIVIASSRHRTRYDSAKHDPYRIEIRPC